MASPSALAEGVLSALKLGLAEMTGDLRSDWEQYAKLIADDAIIMAEAAAMGDSTAEENLEHLLVQTKTLGAMIAIQATDQVVTTLQRVLRIVFSVLVPALIKS